MADIFTEADHGDTENSTNLIVCVLLLLLVFSTQVKHPLNFQDVTRARVSASLNYQSQEVGELLVLNDGSGGNCGISQVLLP